MQWLSLIVSMVVGLINSIGPQLPDATSDLSTPVPFGKAKVAFRDTFDRASIGVGGTWGWKTGAYSGNCTDNPGDFKLDHLTTDALRHENGTLVITAAPAGNGRWNTGLVTTGDSCGSGGSGAEIRTGDILLARVRLPAAGSGAWPALWTWRDGRNEIDVFEWHGDRPGVVEFVNHVRGGNGSYSSDEIEAGAWIYVGARFGADNTVWYVGPTQDRLKIAFEDHTGVGPNFSAYPVLNLSVNNGRYHRAPPAQTPISFAIDSITVYRPAAA